MSGTTKTLQSSVQLLSLSTGLERMSTSILSPKELRATILAIFWGTILLKYYPFVSLIPSQ